MRKLEQRVSSTFSSSSRARTPRASWSTCSMHSAVGGENRSRPDPSLFHLLGPKYLTARARTLGGDRGRVARWVALGVFGVLFWAFIFGVVFRLLQYFRGV